MPVMSKATQRHAATSSHLLSAPLPVFMTFLIICSCSLHTLVQLACICNLLGRWAAHREQLLCESSTDRYEERAHALQRERKQDRQIQKLVSTKSEFLLNQNPLLTCDLESCNHDLSPTLTHVMQSPYRTCERFMAGVWRVVVGDIRAFVAQEVVAGRRLNIQRCRRHYKARSGFVARKC